MVVSKGLLGGGAAPHSSPRPKKLIRRISFLLLISNVRIYLCENVLINASDAYRSHHINHCC